MIVRDARWALPVNVIGIECGCGAAFWWPSNISLARCPACGAGAFWHDHDPGPPPGFDGVGYARMLLHAVGAEIVRHSRET